MATLREVRHALADTLKASIPGLNAYPFTVGAVEPPAVVIYPAPFDYLLVFGNKGTAFEMVIDVFGGTDEEFAQDRLDDLVDGDGDRSIIGKLLANPTLGRTDCHVGRPIRMSHYGTITVGNTPYIGARLNLAVVVSRA